MKTNCTSGEPTFWVGMSANQVRILRFAMGCILLAKEIDAPLAVAVSRNTDSRNSPPGIDNGLLWETVETFEHSLKEIFDGGDYPGLDEPGG